MKLSNFNEYIQTLAALGAILALVVVGYEIRESNRIATQQALSSNWTIWMEQSISEVESGISDIRAKDATTPDQLTLSEKMDLDSYLTGYMYAWHHDYLVLVWDSRSELANEVLDDLSEDAPQYFGTRFSRAWLEKNKFWIDPKIALAIDKGLEGVPIGSGVEYFREIDALAEKIK